MIVQIDAIQIHVRGFKTREVGDEIVKRLHSLGFEIKECCDGTDDSMGGLISTQIMPTHQLETDDLDEIRQAVCVKPGVFLQHQQFSTVDSSD